MYSSFLSQVTNRHPHDIPAEQRVATATCVLLSQQTVPMQPLCLLALVVCVTEKWLSENGHIKNSRKIKRNDSHTLFAFEHIPTPRRTRPHPLSTFVIYSFLWCTWRNYCAHKKIFIILGPRSSSKLLSHPMFFRPPSSGMQPTARLGDGRGIAFSVWCGGENGRGEKSLRLEKIRT